MFEHSASDKMQLVGLGDLRPPASCIACGNGTCTKGYIDVGVSTEWEGNVYLCYYCVVQCAEILGCMIPEEVQHLKNSYDDLALKHTAAVDELEDSRERLKAFDLLLDRNHSAYLVAIGVDSEAVREEQQYPERTTSEPVSSESELQPTPDESVTQSGPDDITEPEPIDITSPGLTGGDGASSGGIKLL